MKSRFSELVIDCHEPKRLAEFWSAVLDYKIVHDSGDEVMIVDTPMEREERRTALRAAAIAPSLLFIQVPEGKTVKNRLHIDVNPIDASQADEVDRLLALGAQHIDIGQGEQNWVVLADPEGNEFCVLNSIQP